MTLPRVFNDPLWLFLLFGSLLFVIAATQEDERVIRVTEGDIQRIEEQWQQQMRRDPTPAERASLINQFIRDEAYYQEALALKLDAGDTIVKRTPDPKAFLFDRGPRGHGRRRMKPRFARFTRNIKTTTEPRSSSRSATSIFLQTDRPVASPEQRADYWRQRPLKTQHLKAIRLCCSATTRDVPPEKSAICLAGLSRKI